MKVQMPMLKIDKYTLRDICRADYLDLFDFGKDSLTTKYLTWGPLTRPSQALWSIENINLKRPLKSIPVGYAIVESKTGKMIGQIDFHTYYKNTNCAEIGFVLHQDYQNKGIMSKCFKEMLKLGFYYQGFSKIIVGHVRENKASEKLIKKMKFKYEETLYNAFENKDSYTKSDIIYYSLYKYEYERDFNDD